MAYFNTFVAWLEKKNSFKLNFFRVHILYFIFTIILSSIIVYGSGVDGNSNNEEARFRLRYIDAIFLCTSAMTNSGLNTVNLSSITAFQQSVLFVLILLGNVTIISTATVVIRRHFMRRYMKEFLDRSEAGRKIVNDIDREKDQRIETVKNEDHNAPAVRRRRRSPAKVAPGNSDLSYRIRHHEKGYGGLPYPWQWSITRKLGSAFESLGDSIEDRPHRYVSFKPSLDERVSPTARPQQN